MPNLLKVALSVSLFLQAAAVADHHLQEQALSDKYQFSHQLHDRYTLYWTYDPAAEEVSFAVFVQTTGWIGFGLSPTGQMPGSDVVIGWVDNDGRSHFDVSCLPITIHVHVCLYVHCTVYMYMYNYVYKMNNNLWSILINKAYLVHTLHVSLCTCVCCIVHVNMYSRSHMHTGTVQCLSEVDLCPTTIYVSLVLKRL